MRMRKGRATKRMSLPSSRDATHFGRPLTRAVFFLMKYSVRHLPQRQDISRATFELNFVIRLDAEDTLRIIYGMTRFEKAKAWRKRHKLTIPALAELTGYGPRAIMWMEQGLSPPNASRKKPAPVNDWIWLRYRMMCSGVERQLETGKRFDW